MIENYVERFPSRLAYMNDRIDFDAKNPAHRKAAMKFFREGVWDLKFNSKWPCTTVPQTILLLLAEFACQKELKEICKNEGTEFKAGDPFNLHTYRPKRTTVRKPVPVFTQKPLEPFDATMHKGFLAVADAVVANE